MKKLFPYLILLFLVFSCENSSKTKGDNMTKSEPKVVCVGGVFFKSENPEELKKWYQDNLGIVTDEYGTMFKSRNIDNSDEINYLQWSPFNKDTDYFNPSKKEFMINYRVQKIEEFVEILKTKGITIVDTIEEYEGIGKFVHILDPDGNKLELWEQSSEKNK